MRDSCSRESAGPCSAKAFAIWFIAGAAAGIAAGLVIAPSRGAETRRRAADRIANTMTGIRQKIENARASAQSAVALFNEEAKLLSAAFAAGIEEAGKIKKEMTEIAESRK